MRAHLPLVRSGSNQFSLLLNNRRDSVVNYLFYGDLWRPQLDSIGTSSLSLHNIATLTDCFGSDTKLEPIPHTHNWLAAVREWGPIAILRFRRPSDSNTIRQLGAKMPDDQVLQNINSPKPTQTHELMFARYSQWASAATSNTQLTPILLSLYIFLSLSCLALSNGSEIAVQRDSGSRVSLQSFNRFSDCDFSHPQYWPNP